MLFNVIGLKSIVEYQKLYSNTNICRIMIRLSPKFVTNQQALKWQYLTPYIYKEAVITRYGMICTWYTYIGVSMHHAKAS